LRINDPALKERIAEAMSDPQHRRIVSATLAKAKSATEIAKELGISTRSAYRHAKNLSQLGILTAESQLILIKGGKETLYRSMVRSVMIRCEGENLEVDLQPNEGIMDRFLRFWSYMGR
jgi:DNA-binding transcriptional ArsR family regulator